MFQQAIKAGVPVHPAPITIIANPVLHDKSDNQLTLTGAPDNYHEDREVRYANGGRTKQRQMNDRDLGMHFTDTTRFISYLPLTETDYEGNTVRRPRTDFVTGTVNMQAYLAWLQQNHYGLSLTVEGAPNP
jgi:hypothetical protein